MSIKKINTRMSVESKDEIVGKFKEIDTLVEPFAVNLSPDDRRTIPKLGIKSLGFADITLGFAKSNPKFVPSFQDIDLLTANMEFVKQLQQVLEVVEPVYEKVKDTYMAAGADVYLATRVIYDSVKAAAKQGVPGSDVIAKELGKLYKRSRAKTKSGEETGDVTDTTAQVSKKNK